MEMEKKKWCLKRLERKKKNPVRKSIHIMKSKSQTILLNRLVIDCFFKVDLRCTELG